jgi:hypothetical protein
MKKLIPLIISSLLVVGAFGCQEAPQASSENPSNNSEPVSAPAKEAAQTTETTAQEAAENMKAAPVTGTQTPAEDIKVAPVTANQDTPKSTKGLADTTKTAAIKTKSSVATSSAKSGLIEAANHLKTNNLMSLAYSKLQEKLPDSNLEVADKNGSLTITGTVLSPSDIAKIAPIVKQLKGVKQVKVAAKVSNDKKTQEDSN